MALGEALPFDTGHFANSISVGAITPGHAPPDSFDEIIRVTRSGGLIVFGMRVDAAQDPSYPAAMAEYESAGRWKKVFETDTFDTMPIGEPDVQTKVYVYRVSD